MVRIPTGGGAEFYGAADGQRTTAPTTNVSFTVALTNGTSATNFQVDDLAIWAMCIPTDNTTPTGFSGQSITATGATFGTAVELNEPDSNVGNDIGGYSAYAFCTAGSSTTAPSVSVTPSGTQANVDNIRGPVVLLRVREARTIDAAVGTFSYTGQDATLTPVRNINAEAGSFSYIGQDATLTSAKNINAEAGAFSYVGQDAELIYVQAAKVLDAEAGSFSYAGQDATLNRTYSFNAEAGAFSYTGQDASFAQGFAVSADAGTFSYIGQDAALNRTYSFNAEAGSFSYIGQDATFIRTLSFTAEAGAFGEADPYVDPGYVDPYYATNLTAALGYGRVFNAESGTFIIAGQPATFLITALFPPESDVRAGVVYGPGGIYVGTYVPSTKQPIYVFDD